MKCILKVTRYYVGYEKEYETVKDAIESAATDMEHGLSYPTCIVRKDTKETIKTKADIDKYYHKKYIKNMFEEDDQLCQKKR